MSELNNNEDLNEAVEVTVDDADVITVPIDDTLSNSGEAADAKAVGDALALKADRSELQTTITVNGQGADNQGVIIVTAADTKMSSSDNTTVKAAIEAVDGKTAADIPMSSEQGAQSIAEAIEESEGRTADAIAMSATDPTTVKSAVETVATNVTNLVTDVSNLANQTAADIRYQSGSNETIKQHVDAMDAGNVKSVNDTLPDEAGNVALDTVPYADNLRTEDMEQVDDDFLLRTTGGELSISGQDAWILRLKGNSVHTGYTAESLNMTVNAIPRTTPPAITATLDEATFEAYVVDAGTYSLNYDGTSWSADPDDYGLTIANTPVDGDIITIVWDGESDAVVSITAGPRTAPPAITATIDRDTFVGYVSTSGTTTLTYTTGWSADPSLYGVTVTNDPIAGDQIIIVYVKEVRGTITPANPTALVATGWNLYNHTAGYARVTRYSSTYGYKIGGTYTSIAFASTPTGTQSAITPDENGLFNVAGDGYVIVTGGNNTNTYILPTWSDWIDGYDDDFHTYTEDSVDLSSVMADYFPYGLLKAGTVRDEIDFNAKQAINRISRQTYSAENLAAAQASGRAYEYDEDYIYLERATALVNEISADAEYGVNDHGLEWFTGAAVEVYTEILYGQNLKDKLRRDVVTVRPQSFTSGQQAQARTNIGLGAAAVKDVANDLTTAAAGSKVLDAYQGNVISQTIGKVQNGLAYIVGDTNTTGGTLAVGQFVYVKGHATIAEGLRKVAASIAANGSITTSNTSACSEGGLNALNSNISTLTGVVNGLLSAIGKNVETDLNNCKIVGTYKASSNSSSNTPGNGFWLVLVIAWSTNDIAQIAVEINDVRMYVRSFHDGTTWTSWKRLDNT